jgi:DNA polymerase-3 subunit delta'
MIDFLSLFKKTNAYKMIKSDKDYNRLAHAYLVLSFDGAYLKEYLKAIASIIACKNGVPCGVCRTCKLIADETNPDVLHFPKSEKGVTTDEVNELIEESYIRPIESDKKIFVITAKEPLSPIVQNKLLKILEEPPKNVHIIIGAQSEYSLLPTLLSRVRKLEIPAFTDQVLFEAIKGEGDEKKLKQAIASSDGTVGGAISLANDENLENTVHLVTRVLTEMKSSRDVLKFSNEVLALKGGLNQFLSVLSLALEDILLGLFGAEGNIKNKQLYQKTKNDSGFNQGSIVYALEKVNEAQKRKQFNANATMLVEWLLFQILEGKFKWKK